jgi:hypothetical protein
MTSTQQNGPKSMTTDGGWTSISSCLVQGEKEELMRGRARRATYHRNSTYSLELVSGLPRWVSGTLFSHHMADIIAIDHNRRDGHAGFLADFNCIQRFDECRNSTFGERLKGLDYKLSSAGVGTQVRFEIEPRRCRMTTPVWVMSHIRCAAEAGKTPRRLVITGTRSSPSSLCPRASVGDSGTPRRRE